MRPPHAFVLALVLAGCGAAEAPPATPPPSTSQDSPPAVATEAVPPQPPPPPTMPSACAAGPDPTACTPPSAFVDALCSGNYLDATFTLFAKGSPWTRAYLRGDVDSWYASGGGSARAKLLFDEEVLVLRVRPAASTGVVVGNGSAGYDVLRWDGLCYTVDAGELTMKHPPRAKYPSLPFRHFGEATQATFLANGKVKAAYAKRGKECHGVSTGDVTQACARADHALGEAVIEYVGAGGALPPPSRVPGG